MIIAMTMIYTLYIIQGSQGTNIYKYIYKYMEIYIKVIGVLLTSCLFSRLHRLDKYSPGCQSSHHDHDDDDDADDVDVDDDDGDQDYDQESDQFQIKTHPAFSLISYIFGIYFYTCSEVGKSSRGVFVDEADTDDDVDADDDLADTDEEVDEDVSSHSSPMLPSLMIYILLTER